MAKKQLEWKRVCETYGGKDTPTCSTYRAKVPGGWLVAVWSGATNETKNEDTNRQTFGGGVTFLRDPDYKWAQEVDEHETP